jgi:hypothetical protein
MRLRLGASLLLVAAVAAAQQASNFAKPRVAGRALASQFGKWSVMADGPILGNGQAETVRLRASAFTLPDGTAFQPLAVGTPVAIGGDANPETVTPLSVACGVGGSGCTFTAVFQHAHAGHFSVGSATGGLQEAINYESQAGGGIVEIDPEWQGTLSSVLPELKLPADVLLIDETGGNWTVYGLGNGGAPQVLGGYSSAAGADSDALAGLNGAAFASANGFSVAGVGTLAGGIAATITPAWTRPAGVVAGDSVYISGGSGAAEVVDLSNVGTGCPAGTAASVCFTPAGSHSGAWTLASATDGLQEAVNRAGAGGWVIDDLPTATLWAPLVLARTVRLSGFSAFDGGVGTTIEQLSPNTDTIQIGTSAATANDVFIEHLMALGVRGDGSDSGVAFHCLNCVHLKLEDVVGKQAHDGLYFDSTYGHAYVGDVTDSHFIGNYYGVHIVGGSANRLTFVGDTVDSNQYGVFDDGGWVHTWVGDDIEYNAQYGYWQQISAPAAYSGHNVDLESDYFEDNGSTAGQGDIFLGQLVNGGSGNNGAGCINCQVSDSLFNASNSNVTALSLGAVQGTVSANTYSGYGPSKTYAYITGPDPNFTQVISLGDNGTITPNGEPDGSFGGTAPGTITRLDPNGALVLGGTDRLTDKFGSMLSDTTIESPTGLVRLRGKPGGASSSNPAMLYLDGNSTALRSNEIRWRNGDVDEWGIKNDVTGANAHDFCLANDYANPAAATCDLYINQQKHFQFSGAGVPGNITFDADYRFKQQANGDPALQIMRYTDSAPNGYLLDVEDATESHPLFRVDAVGNVTGNGTINIAGAATFQSSVSIGGALSAATATISGAAALGSGSTVGGKAINTDAAVVSGQSGVWWNGTYAAIGSTGQCISGGINFSSGVAIGMAVASNPETLPPAGLMWTAVIDAANHVTINVCNITNGPITWPSGSIWDVRVIP